MNRNNSQQIFNKIKELKALSGTHSPSITTLLEEVPELKIEVDACFLSNPYATELFMKRMDEDLISTSKLRDVLEYYPPQNRDVSNVLAKALQINAKNIFIGNGAIEIIQALLHNFITKKICIIIPTFSSYYEFVPDNIEVVFFKLKKENNFEIDAEQLIEFCKNEQVDSLVLINPNNPNGGYLLKENVLHIVKNLKHLSNIILDESFIHFAYEDVNLSQINSEDLILKYPNVCIVKSMSKDFGIAGIRAGYAIMNERFVNQLLSGGYLWNVSGLADYFFKLYSDGGFQEEYKIVRKKYIMNTLMFLGELTAIENIKVYPSKANFALVELLNGETTMDYSLRLLSEHGIYVRDCSDKIGLQGQFLRIASRTFEENLKIITALKTIS